MPLHLDSITNNSQDSSLIAWILQSGTQECDSAFATPDKKYIHNTDDTRRIFLSLCFTCTLFISRFHHRAQTGTGYPPQHQFPGSDKQCKLHLVPFPQWTVPPR